MFTIKNHDILFKNVYIIIINNKYLKYVFSFINN